MRKIYLVMRNADSTEGRGPMLPSLVFSTFDTAVKYISKQSDGWGAPQPPKVDSDAETAYGNGLDIRPMRVFDTIPEVEENALAELRKSALKKLSAAERKALNLE